MLDRINKMDRKFFLGVWVLVAISVFQRAYLEQADKFLYNWFVKSFIDDVILFRTSTNISDLFIPGKINLGGFYGPISFIIFVYLTQWFSVSALWCISYVLLIITSFFTSYSLLKSRVFSYTFTILLCFGTHLYVLPPCAVSSIFFTHIWQ